MEAIVYTSNSGFTKQYAEMLHNRTGLPVYSLKDAQKNLTSGCKIVYLGWNMGGIISGYKQADELYTIIIVCAVGMRAETEGTVADIANANNIKLDKLHYLQGGFDIKRLHGGFRLMMSVMRKKFIKEITEKSPRTAADEDMLTLLTVGGSRVSEASLLPIIAIIDQ